MFNDYQWNLYLKAGGRQVVEMFEKNLTGEFTEEYICYISKFHKFYCPIISITNEINEQLVDIINDLNYGYSLLDEGKYNILSALEFVYNGIKGEDNLKAQKIFEFFSGSIPFYTTFLSIELPDLFTPYYFQFNFNFFEKICKEFEINIPEIPVKKDYEDRFYYYGALCASFTEFRDEHNMTPYEFCAFLYDYAPKVIGGIDSYIIKNIPEPTSAFFIGGTKDDAFLSYNKDVIDCWQCSPDAQPGDIAVMYLKTPISSVDSVWRCVSEGFNDPFAYYYRFVYIAKPYKIKRVSKNKLEKDKILRNIGIIRKNMQGINGVELKPSEYNHLMDLAKAPDLKLKYAQPIADVEISREEDVEKHLIKPLLEKLKYREKNYTQQLHIELGNHNTTLIPDFVLLPDETVGNQKAFAIIEAKKDIPNKKAFQDVKIQARSYARQLLSKYSVIASQEKVYISSCDDDFENYFFVKTWEELENPDTFSQLYKLIGNTNKNES
ncbi:MAG: type I restriction enzyme HsdR N-terminal domain-containing protein [Eubacterium sp.]